MRDLFRMIEGAVALLALTFLALPGCAPIPSATTNASSATTLVQVTPRQALLLSSKAYVGAAPEVVNAIESGELDRATIIRLRDLSNRIESVLLRAHSVAGTVAAVQAAAEAAQDVAELISLLPQEPAE